HGGVVLLRLAVARQLLRQISRTAPQNRDGRELFLHPRVVDALRMKLFLDERGDAHPGQAIAIGRAGAERQSRERVLDLLARRNQRRARCRAARDSGTPKASARSRYTTPNEPNTAAAFASAATREAGRPASRNRTPRPTAPAPRAAAQRRKSSPAGTSALPTRLATPRRS